MKKKRILSAAIVFSAAMLTLTGCLSSEEKNALNEMKDDAEAYIESKYGEDFKLSDSGYHMDSDVFSYATSNMWFEFTDGTTVYYDAEGEDGEPVFYDDKQAAEISKAVIDEILNPAFEEMGDVRIGSSDKSAESAFRFGNLYKDYSFFHEYYNGDIKSYLSMEKVFIGTDDTIYIVCSEDEWEAVFDICKKKLCRYLYTDGYIDFLAVTEEGYRNDVSDYNEDGAFAGLHWSVRGAELSSK